MLLFKQLVSRFSYVSTREINGIRFCRERGINAERCIDSTFLLSADHYIGLATNRKYQSDFAYLYLLNVGTPNEIHFNEVLKEINKKAIKPFVRQLLVIVQQKRFMKELSMIMHR